MAHGFCKDASQTGSNMSNSVLKFLRIIMVLPFCVAVAGKVIAGPLDVLPGRWSGWGELTMASGETEKVRCIATYVRGADALQLRHNLRCASSSYTIDVLARLSVAGDRVSGEWVERK